MYLQVLLHFFSAPYQTHDFDQVDKEQNKHLKRALLVTDILGFTKQLYQPLLKHTSKVLFFFFKCSGLNLCNKNIYENLTERSTLDSLS